ncbi:MAG: hypothetical protein IKP42_07385 [Ruminococcus sp.]|nr:hypothetical protein [Ruminococcus sp.]
MNLKRLLAGTAAAALLAVTASCGSNNTSKTSYRSDETSKASDSVPAGTGYDSKVVAAKDGPKLSFSNVEAAPGERVGVTLSVSGAEKNWSMCGIHVTYGEELECIVKNEAEGYIDYKLGSASEFSTGSVGMIWTNKLAKELTDNHLGALFFTEIFDGNDGLDGDIATFYFRVPSDAKPGTVYPIGIYYMPPTEQREDMFRNAAGDLSLEKYAFENWVGGSVTVK